MKARLSYLKFSSLPLSFCSKKQHILQPNPQRTSKPNPLCNFEVSVQSEWVSSLLVDANYTSGKRKICETQIVRLCQRDKRDRHSTSELLSLWETSQLLILQLIISGCQSSQSRCRKALRQTEALKHFTLSSDLICFLLTGRNKSDIYAFDFNTRDVAGVI